MIYLALTQSIFNLVDGKLHIIEKTLTSRKVKLSLDDETEEGEHGIKNMLHCNRCLFFFHKFSS